MHLVGFNIRIYHDARSPERQYVLIYLSVQKQGIVGNKGRNTDYFWMRQRFQKQHIVILILETWSVIADTHQNKIFDNKAILEQMHTYPHFVNLFTFE